MTVISDSAERFLDRFPQYRELAVRTLAAFAGVDDTGCSFDRLLQITQPSSAEGLAIVLTELTRDGLLDRRVCVTSASGKKAEYQSIFDVPPEVPELDPTADVHVFFRRHREE